MQKRWTEDQILKIVQEVQADIHAGLEVEQSLRKFGIVQANYYRWKTRLETPLVPEEQRTRELEAENERLKLLVADVAMDRRMLQEALKRSRDCCSTPSNRDRSTRRFHVSERRTCCALGLARSSQRSAKDKSLEGS